MKFLPFFLLTIFFLSLSNSADAQLLKRLRQTAERAAENAVHRKVYEKTTEAVEDVLTDPEEQEREKQTRQQDDTYENSTESQRTSTANNGRSNKQNQTATETAAETRPAFTAYSKFDFVPGNEIVYYEEFERTLVGDFPTGWNTNGSAEVVTTNTGEGKFLQMTNATGSLVPLDLKTFPENFTLEFDVIHNLQMDEYAYQRDLAFIFTTESNAEVALGKKFPGAENLYFELQGGISGGIGKSVWYKNTNGTNVNGKAVTIGQQMNTNTRGEVMHVAIWRQGKRVRLYLNERKVYDVPMAWNPSEPFTAFRLLSEISREDESYLISNLRMAVGAPDLRTNKLVTEGRLVTYGITFATNSAEVEATSYGTLRQLAQVLQQHPDLKINIIGHTDGDGETAYNQQLSEERAAAVKTVLTEQFDIATDRLQTSGKGESEPVADNDSAAGKAKNRRVELVKI